MLTLKDLVLSEGKGHPPAIDYTFNVCHNDSGWKTKLDFNLALKMDRNSKTFSGVLVIDELKNAESIDAARLKMAEWCVRVGAALTHVERVPGDIPTYEKRPFDLERQPSWVQAEFARLLPRFLAIAAPAPSEDRSDVLAEMTAEQNPLLFIYGAWENLVSHSYSDE